MDNTGRAIAVWEQSDGTRNNIRSNYYLPGSGWNTATTIENSNGEATNQQIAMDNSGNALALWAQHDGTYYSIYSNTFSFSHGWKTPEKVENNTGHTSLPHVAIKNNDYALAVWHQLSTQNDIWANRYSLGNGTWSSAHLIESDDSGDAEYTKIGMDNYGNAFSIWQQQDGLRYNIWSARYDAANASWRSPDLIEVDDLGDATEAQISVSAYGNGAMAVWQQSDGARTNIWANHYTTGSGWGTAQMIETNNAGDAKYPQIAMDNNGTSAIAVWQQSDGTRTNIWANHYSSESGWGMAEMIETNNAGNAEEPKVGMNGNGTSALVVWQQNDGTYLSIYANHYH
jgi:hypothetical protein